MKKIILITGGERSGKSSYAERLAHEWSTSPVYMATAKIWDEEFRREKELSRHDITGRVAVIDCVTLWCTNYFVEQPEVALALEALKQEFDRFTAQDATFIFVTNEIGMGGVSPNEVQRRFTDLQGWMNQYIASKADQVVLMVCGIPVKVKG